MWGLRATIIRAAGVAALAFGFQAFRWLTGRKDGEEDDGLLVSPVRKQAVCHLKVLELWHQAYSACKAYSISDVRRH